MTNSKSVSESAAQPVPRRGGDRRAQAEAAGKRVGRPPKPRVELPEVDVEIATRILERIKEEETVIALLQETRANDKRLFWEILKEMQHQARGKPVTRIANADDSPFEVRLIREYRGNPDA